MKKLFLLLAAVLSLTQMMAQTVPITIGTGTSTGNYGPIPGYYGNHRSIQLFTATELGQPTGCVIDSIALELGSVTAGSGGRDVRIYMKEVADTTVATSQVIGTLTDGAVLVYSSAADGEVCTSNTWHTFSFQTPFAYSGGNSLVIIFEGEGCTASGGCAVNIKYTSVPGKVWTKCWDTTAPDFTTPIATNNAYRANTRFYVSSVMPDDYCTPASNFVISDLTTDGVVFSWTSDATSFEYEYKPASENWNSENVVSSTTTSTSVSLSGLASGTSYNFRVKASCASGTESSWIEVSFLTPCDVYPVPYQQGFEQAFDFTFGSGFAASPLCWANVNGDASTTYYWKTSTTNHSGGQSAYYYGTTSATPAQSDWLITPAFELSGNEAANFFIKKISATYATGLKIYAYDISEGDIATPADTSLFTLIETIPASALTTTDWYDVGVNLSSLNGNYRLALVPTANTGSLYIDDFEVVETSCFRPVMSGLTVSDVTSTDASLSWTDENASAWKVYYKPLSASEYQSETASSTSLNLSGLQPGTAYTAYVVADCGEEESGSTFSVSFITECAVISEFPWVEGFEAGWNTQNLMTGTITAPYCWFNINGGGSSYKWETTSTSYEGSKAAYMSGYGSSSATSATYKNDDWLITPVLELTGNEVLSFYAKKSSTSYTPELRIYAYALTDGDMTSVADTANFVAIDSIADLVTDYTGKEVSLEGLSGQYRLAFVRNKTIGHGAVYLDNVTVKAASVCQRVQNLAVTNITDTEITLSWDADENATSYNIYYKASGASDWTIEPATTSPYTIQNLTPTTVYTINAKVVCSDETETDFTTAPSLSATTLCSPYPVPFLEDFATFPNLTSTTSCWKRAKGVFSELPTTPLTDESVGWQSLTRAGVFEGSQHAKINIYKTSQTGTGQKDWMISPTINLGDGSTQYDLKFYFALTKYNSADAPVGCQHQRFMVLISADGGSTWDSVPSLTWEAPYADQETNDLSAVSTSGQIVKANLTELGYTGNVRFAFYAYQQEYVSGQDNDLHIDDVRVIEHVDCADLLTIDAVATSTTSIALSWDTSTDTGDGWTIRYAEGTTITADAENAQTVNVPYGTEFPYILENLTPGMTYSFMVQYDCGGAWSNPETVTLPVSIATIPYTCDFEDEEENATWTLTNRNDHTSKWYVGAETDSTNHKLYISSDNGATSSYNVSGANVVYASRDIQFAEAGAYKIEFDWIAGGEGVADYLKVALRETGETLTASTTTPSWAGSSYVEGGFTYVNTNKYYNFSGATASHAEIIVDGATVNNTVKKLIFVWKQDGSLGTQPGAMIDNISITEVNCMPPTDITLAEEGRQANSLIFDIADETASEWEIQYRVYGTDEWSSAFFTSATGAELNDLLSGTMYQIKVRSICGDGDSSWFTDAVLYSTLCEAIAVTEETPYFEGFENLFTGGNTLSTSGRSAPVCWFNIDGKHTSRYWGNTSVASNVYAGTKALYFNNSTSATADTISDWFVTPVFDLAGTETFSFFAKLNSAGTYPLKVMYYSVDENEDMTSQADTSNFQLLSTINLSEATYLPFDVTLNELTPGQYRLAFYASAPGRDVYIDNVSLSIISCQRPDGLSITFSEVGPNTATVNWEDESNTAWTVHYKSSTESDYTSIPATTTTVALTDLTANSDYEVYITATCGESESEASIHATFSTPCDYITEFPYEEGFETAWITKGLSNKTAPSCWINIDGAGTSTYIWSRTTVASNVRTGTGAAYSCGYGSSTATSESYINKDYLISPVISVEGGARLSFYAKKANASYNGKIKIKYYDVATNGDMASVADTANFVDLIEINDFTTAYSLYELDFSSLPSTYRIAFVRQDTAQGSIYIDDLKLDNVPTCTRPVPSSVVASGITTNAANISWTDLNEANTSYNVYYRQTGTEDFEMIAVNNATNVMLTDLVLATSYDVYVTTNCGSEESETTDTLSFMTQVQEAEPIPYTCNFDTENDNEWLLKNGTCTNKWYIGTPTGATSGVLFISNNGTTSGYTDDAMSIVVAEKLFQTGTSDSLTISFDLTIGGESTYDYLKVFWISADSASYEASTSNMYYSVNSYSPNVIIDNSTNASHRFVNLLTGTQTMSATIANQPNTLRKLVFVWKNDTSNGTQPGAIIDNLSIIETGGEVPVPCDAPTALTASNVTETGATVSWNGTASSYEVRLAGGTAETVTTTSKTFTGLTAGTTYTVEVRAVCESGNSSWVSTTFTTQSSQVDPCDAPTALTASNVTETGATVSWNGTASSYEVRLAGGTAETVTTTSKTFTNLTAGTAYTVEVRAVCESSQSAWVSTSFTTQNAQGVTAPTVTTLAATEITHEAATLNGTITAGSEAITAQGFKYKATTATEWTTVSATGTTLTATVNNLTAETAYEYKAFATTESGTVEGTVMNFTTAAAPVVAPTVTTLAATSVTHEAATLNGTITAGSEAITAQGFKYKATTATEWTTVSATGTTLTATVNNLTAETAYEYKAFATTASGTVEGEVMNFTTLAASGLADIENGISAIVYPNPAKDKAMLRLSGLTTTAKVIISDLQGRIILTDDIQAGVETYELNTSNYASGVYYIRIVSGNKVNTQKLIVE